jgi:KaiC/GvpD/RAD55 family RecA-like ATPase
VADPTWGEEFQRVVIACAVRGDLLSSLPSAFRAELFGAATGAQSPRQRIAAAVVDYWQRYGVRPEPVVFREVVRRLAERLPEREVVELEAKAILEAELPDDTQFIRDEVRAWAELKSLEQGLVQTAGLLAAGSSAVPAARDVLAGATRPIDVADRKSVSYLADAEARLEAWRRGDEYGERIPTGFPELDRVLNGGPTRREVFYFLAPPKGAKTASLLKVASHAARRRYGVYVVTYEMQAFRMALRLDRMFARQSKEELRDDLARLESILTNMRQYGCGEIVIDERPPQHRGAVAEVAARVRQLRRDGRRVDVVVLDYLNIMGASRDEREKRHELARVSRDIGAMAKELDVLVWSAALVNRASVNKQVIRKVDIAEAFEVVAVADGMVAICATKRMIEAGYRRFYVAAAREEADEVRAGDYRVDFARMEIEPTAAEEVDALLIAEAKEA